MKINLYQVLNTAVSTIFSFQFYYVCHKRNPSFSLERVKLKRHNRAMPVILATQEAEIRRIAVQSQPKQIVCETTSKNPITKKGWWSGSTCRPSSNPSTAKKRDTIRF
jgi:hypothetical protein